MSHQITHPRRRAPLNKKPFLIVGALIALAVCAYSMSWRDAFQYFQNAFSLISNLVVSTIVFPFALMAIVATIGALFQRRKGLTPSKRIEYHNITLLTHGTIILMSMMTWMAFATQNLTRDADIKNRTKYEIDVKELEYRYDAWTAIMQRQGFFELDAFRRKCISIANNAPLHAPDNFYVITINGKQAQPENCSWLQNKIRWTPRKSN